MSVVGSLANILRSVVISNGAPMISTPNKVGVIIIIVLVGEMSIGRFANDCATTVVSVDVVGIDDTGLTRRKYEQQIKYHSGTLHQRCNRLPVYLERRVTPPGIFFSPRRNSGKT